MYTFGTRAWVLQIQVIRRIVKLKSKEYFDGEKLKQDYSNWKNKNLKTLYITKSEETREGKGQRNKKENNIVKIEQEEILNQIEEKI